ncbi:hypothetical protein D9M68_786310 [compost metagenome]
MRRGFQTCLCWRRYGELQLALKNVRLREAGVAFPIEFCFAASPADAFRLSICPRAAEREMILMISTHTREMLHDRYPVSFQLVLRANA